MQKHVSIHIFMQFFMSFYGGQLKQFYTANFFLWVLNLLKWWSSSSFSILMVQMLFFTNFNRLMALTLER